MHTLEMASSKSFRRATAVPMISFILCASLVTKLHATPSPTPYPRCLGAVDLHNGDEFQLIAAPNSRAYLEPSTISLTESLNSVIYFGKSCDSSSETYSPSEYSAVKLADKTFSWTVDLSELGCSCAVALYLVPMAHQMDNANGDYSCNVNDPEVRCTELDLMQANAHAFHVSIHSASSDTSGGVSGGYGGGTAKVENTEEDESWIGPRDFSKEEYGPGGACVDTREPFRVQAVFGTTAAADGDPTFAFVKAVLTQAGCSLHTAKVGLNYATDELTALLAQGLTPVVATYGSDDGSQDLRWLSSSGSDGQGPCDANMLAHSKARWCGQAVLSEFAIGDASDVLGKGEGGDDDGRDPLADGQGFCCFGAQSGFGDACLGCDNWAPRDNWCFEKDRCVQCGASGGTAFWCPGNPTAEPTHRPSTTPTHQPSARPTHEPSTTHKPTSPPPTQKPTPELVPPTAATAAPTTTKAAAEEASPTPPHNASSSPDEEHRNVISAASVSLLSVGYFCALALLLVAALVWGRELKEEAHDVERAHKREAERLQEKRERKEEKRRRRREADGGEGEEEDEEEAGGRLAGRKPTPPSSAVGWLERALLTPWHWTPPEGAFLNTSSSSSSSSSSSRQPPKLVLVLAKSERMLEGDLMGAADVVLPLLSMAPQLLVDGQAKLRKALRKRCKQNRRQEKEELLEEEVKEEGRLLKKRNRSSKDSDEEGGRGDGRRSEEEAHGVQGDEEKGEEGDDDEGSDDEKGDEGDKDEPPLPYLSGWKSWEVQLVCCCESLGASFSVSKFRDGRLLGGRLGVAPPTVSFPAYVKPQLAEIVRSEVRRLRQRHRAPSLPQQQQQQQQQDGREEGREEDGGNGGNGGEDGEGNNGVGGGGEEEGCKEEAAEEAECEARVVEAVVQASGCSSVPVLRRAALELCQALARMATTTATTTTATRTKTQQQQQRHPRLRRSSLDSNLRPLLRQCCFGTGPSPASSSLIGTGSNTQGKAAVAGGGGGGVGGRKKQASTGSKSNGNDTDMFCYDFSLGAAPSLTPDPHFPATTTTLRRPSTYKEPSSAGPAAAASAVFEVGVGGGGQEGESVSSSSQLPARAKLLLLASFIASHTKSEHDMSLFTPGSSLAGGKGTKRGKRRKGLGSSGGGEDGGLFSLPTGAPVLGLFRLERLLSIFGVLWAEHGPHSAAAAKKRKVGLISGGASTSGGGGGGRFVASGVGNSSSSGSSGGGGMWEGEEWSQISYHNDGDAGGAEAEAAAASSSSGIEGAAVLQQIASLVRRGLLLHHPQAGSLASADSRHGGGSSIALSAAQFKCVAPRSLASSLAASFGLPLDRYLRS